MATSALTLGLGIPSVACGCEQEQAATQGRYLLADVAGTYVPATLTINYEDAVYTEVTYRDEGVVDTEDVVYADGAGSLIFENVDGTWHLTWDDALPRGQGVGLHLVGGRAWPPVTRLDTAQEHPVTWMPSTVVEKPHAGRSCEGYVASQVKRSWDPREVYPWPRVRACPTMDKHVR